MKTHFKPLIKFLAAFLVALGTVACTNISAQKQSASHNQPATSPALTGAQLAEQQIAAIEKTRVQEADYLKGLATTVKGEKRNDAWAAQKESELWTSYAAEKGIPRGALKSVECRSSKCDLQLQVSAEQSPKAAVEQQIAINQWIAWSQPCGYTMTTGSGLEQPPGAIRIFLDCSK